MNDRPEISTVPSAKIEARMQLAQAETPAQPVATEGTPAGPFPAPTPETTYAAAVASGGLPVDKTPIDQSKVIMTITPVPGKAVSLPSDTQIAAIMINGEDLVIREADGDLIVIQGGVKNIPNLSLGEFEIPGSALLASLQANGVTLTAAGGDGAAAAGANGQPSSGGNFARGPGGIGDAFDIRDLLDFSERDREIERRDEEEGGVVDRQVAILDLTPSISGGDAKVLEEGLDDGSESSSNVETTQGSFIINAPDGVDDLIIGGVTVISNGQMTGAIVDTPFGKLQLISFNPDTGEVVYSYTIDTQVEHPAGMGKNGGVFDNLTVVLTDRDGDKAEGVLSIEIIDDVPTVTVVANSEGSTKGLYISVDETVGLDRGEGANGNFDDAGPGLGQQTSQIQGGLLSLFTVGGAYNADGAGSLTEVLSFSGVPVGGLPTNLEATNGGAITLKLINGDLVGVDSQGDNVFTIEIVGTGNNQQLQLTIFEAVRHPDGIEIDYFDESIGLFVLNGGVGLTLTATRIDGDEDVVVASAEIPLIGTMVEGQERPTSYFNFEDDGPEITLVIDQEALSALKADLDESVGADVYAVGEDTDGGPLDDVVGALAQKTTNIEGGLTTLFIVAPDFGSDGPGTVTAQTLQLTLPNVEGGVLTTLSSTAGGPISLYLENGVIVGRDSNGGPLVLSIAIVTVDGVPQLQTTLFEAIRHDNNEASFDEVTNLLLYGNSENESEIPPSVGLHYVVTIVDGDGDSKTVSAEIDLITTENTFVSIDDDGPTLGTLNPAAAVASELKLDESSLPGSYDPDQDGLRTITANFADNFSASAVDYGSDGPGTVEYDFLLDIQGAATGLFALDRSDKETVEDALGKGAAIVLYQLEDGTIVGSTAAALAGVLPSNTYFTISVDGAGVVTFTQSQNLWHPTNPGSDEPVGLNLAIGTLVLEQTVTDGDGDSISAKIEMGGGVFTIEDAGPSLDIEVAYEDDDDDDHDDHDSDDHDSDDSDDHESDDENEYNGIDAIPAMELDESLGRPDTYATGEIESGSNANIDDPLSGPALAVKSTSIAGGLGGLFNVTANYGTDGEGSIVESFAFIGLVAGSETGVRTSLYATHGGQISLFLSADGKTLSGMDGTTSVFTIAITGAPGSEQLTTTLFEAIAHPNTATFDENLVLALAEGGLPIKLEYTVTITDADGDGITKSSTIDLVTTKGSSISFDDDGPQISAVVAGNDNNGDDHDHDHDHHHHHHNNHQNGQAQLTLTVGHDETPGTGVSPPNTANDQVAAPASLTVAWATGGVAIGYASSGASVTADDLFTNVEFGSDGAGSLVYSLSSATAGSELNGVNSGLDATVAVNNSTDILLYTETVDGVQVVWGIVGGNLTSGVKVFALSLDANGQLWVAQFKAIAHSLDGNTDAAHDDIASITAGLVHVTATITDGDGDKAMAVSAEGIKISFQDDGPSVSAVANVASTVALDETATSSTTATINTGSVTKGDDPHVANAGYISKATSVGALVTATTAFGTDGEAPTGSVSYALTVINATSGLRLTDGSTINLQLVGSVVVGVVNGGTYDDKAAFAISIDPVTGVVTVEQYLSLDHPTEANSGNGFNSYDEAIALAANSLGVTVTVKDGDGDTKTSAAVGVGSQITFDDDGPSATAEAPLSLFEGTTISGTFDFVSGADGASLSQINGVTLSFNQSGGWTNWIDLGRGDIRVQADGDYEFRADAATISPVAAITGTFTVRDGDNDTLVRSFEFNIQDKNKPTGGSEYAEVDDDGLTGANPSPTSEEFDSGTLNGSIGLDTPGSFSFAALHGTNGMIGTEAVTYTWASNVLTATGPRGVLLTVSVTPTTGAYTVELKDNVLHVAGNGANPTTVLGYVITDGDGSQANGTLTIEFGDDGPTARSDIHTIAEDTVSVSGNVITDNDALNDDNSGSTPVATDGLDVFGADGAALSGSIVWTGAVGNAITTANGVLTVDGVGGYTYTPNQAAINALDTGETRTEIFTYTIKDGDGDTSQASLTVTITGTNDLPIVAADTNWVKEDGPVSATGNVLQTLAHPNDPSASLSFADAADSDVDDALSVVAATINGTYGQLVLGANGAYTYTLYSTGPTVATVQGLDDGETRTDVFNYNVTDGTATVPSSLTITIFGTNDAPTVTAAATAVSEEGLTGGLVDGVGTDDTTNVKTITGTMVASDVDVETLNFVFTGAPTITSNGVTIGWIGLNSGTLVGMAGSVEVITVTIGATGAYVVTLGGPIDHANGAIEDDRDLVFDVSVSDGTVSTPSTLTVTVEDDAPDAVGETYGTLITSTGATVLTGLLANDKFGADGPALNNSVTVLSSSNGTVTYDSNSGNFSYTPIGNVNGPVTFTYQIKDADGDTDTATVTLNVQTNTVPSGGGSVALTVDEEGLDTVLNANDLRAGVVAGTNPGASTESAQGSGTLSFTATGEGLSVSLAAPTGLDAPTVTGLGTGYTINWALVSGQLQGSLISPTSVNLGVAIVVGLDASAINAAAGNTVVPIVKVTISDNLIHANGAGNVVVSNVTLNATDTSGDIVQGKATVTVIDDVPVVLPDNDTNTHLFSNSAGSVNGDLTFDIGADVQAVVKSITSATSPAGLTSSGIAIIYDTSTAGVVIGHTGNTLDPVFTLTVDPITKTYEFDLIKALDGAVTPNVLIGGSSFGAGPENYQILTTSGGASLAVVTGWKTNGGGFTIANWQAGNNTGVVHDKVNGSANGWGVDNQNMTTGEMLRFDFGSLTDFDGAGGYVPPSFDGPNVSVATFDLSSYGGSDQFYYVVHFTDGSSAAVGNFLNSALPSEKFTYTAPSGKFIADIELYSSNAGGAGKVELESVTTIATTVDIDLDFTVKIVDADGDEITLPNIHIDVRELNNAPAGTNKTFNLVEDVSYTYSLSDFGFSDADGHGFAGVVINTLPASSAGVLRLGNVALVAGTFVTADQIGDGMLIYTPTDNVFGNTGDTSFTFSVRDYGPTGGSNVNQDQSPNTMTLDMSGTDYTNTTTSGSSNTTTLNLTGSNISLLEGGGNSDVLAIDTANGGVTNFDNLNLMRADNNLELAWSAGGSSRIVTLEDQYGDEFEILRFDDGARFAGRSLGSSDYELEQDFTGGNNSEIFAGTATSDTIDASDGNDLLFGNGGDDILNGGDGSDIFSGGLGEDSLNLGASDNDRDHIFIDASALSGVDTINDFLVGTGASSDVVDLSELFNVTAANGGIGAFVKVEGTSLSVDVDGTANGTNFVQIATVTGRVEGVGNALSILYTLNGTDDQSGTIT